MANTTNFGWETPDDTDLVKDGALAMRTLGNAIDTSLVDLKGGTTGQVLSKNTNTDMDFTWVTPNDADAIQNSIVDAKGDLITATAADVPARLAVGANDLILTAASGETTGLKWSGGWTTYTPSWTGLTVGNGTVTARYAQVGKIVTVMVRLVFGSTTSITGGFVQVTVPVTSNISAGGIGQAYFLDNGVADYPGIVKQDSSTLFSINPISSDATYVGVKSMTSTVPFTWGTNDVINFVVTYEAA